MPDAVQPVKGIVHAQFQVLRRDLVGDVNHRLQVFRHNNLAVVVNGYPGNVRPFQLGNLLFQLIPHLFRQFHGVGYQHRAGHFVVFRLAQQVRRQVSGIGLTVRRHQDFARPGDHINGNNAVHLALGFRHKGVSGAHDLVRLRHGFRSVCQGSDGLRAACLHNPVRSGHFGGGQDSRVDLPVFSGRCGHNHFLHAGNLGGNHVHQHRGGKRSSAAGHINAGPVHRDHLLSHHNAGFIINNEGIAHLTAVELPDVGRGLLQDCQESRIRLGQRFLHFLRGHQHAVQLRAVIFFCIFQQGFISPLPHVPDNLRNLVGHVYRRHGAGEDLVV